MGSKSEALTATIPLRMLLMFREGKVDIICLETNIAVTGANEPEAIAKMRDATTLYLESFSDQEIAKRKYKRPAPLKYQILSLITALAHNVRRYRADYNSADKNLRFA
jgi:hypothetical protein